MAADIVPSLFGLTPEMYQQSQQARADQQALQYAQLSPFQQANYAVGRGANMLGGAIGRGLGGEDPELARITMRQQIAGRINPNDPESIKQGIEALAPNDPQGAMMLQREYQRLLESNALVGQRGAAAQASLAQAGREAKQAIPPQLLISERIADLNTQLDLLSQQPQSPERDAQINLATRRLEAIEKQIEKPEKPENKTEIQRLQEYAASLPAGSPLLAQVQAVIKAKSEPAGPKITNVLPGQPVPTKDWMDFTQKVLSGDPIMQRTSTILSDAPSAIEIIRNSKDNDFAAASLPTSIALLTGQGKNMSNADVNRFARTGGLDDRLAQDAVKFFTGRTTQVKKDQAEKFAVALYRGALIERKKKLQTSAEEFGYTESPNYKTALRNIDDQLSQFKLVKKGESAPATQKTGNPLIDKYLFPQVENK
jgi:hypothetical protein